MQIALGIVGDFRVRKCQAEGEAQGMQGLSYAGSYA